MDSFQHRRFEKWKGVGSGRQNGRKTDTERKKVGKQRSRRSPGTGRRYRWMIRKYGAASAACGAGGVDGLAGGS
jgi:hypothetical protein